MDIDYARAYHRERIARAHVKRRERQAVQLHQWNGDASALRIRAAVGNRLINIGERLSSSSSTVSSPARGNT